MPPAFIKEKNPMFKTYQKNMIERLLRLLGIAGVAFIMLTMPAIGADLAVSADRDHPTALTSNELKGELDGTTATESFYSFVAGPGDLTVTVDVKSTDGTAVLNFELLDKDAATSLASSFAQAGAPGQSGREIQTIKLDSRQTVVLLLRQASGKGSFTLRLSGVAVADTQPAVPKLSQVSDRMGLPKIGTLRIESTDGSAQEFDLSHVKFVSVKQ